MNPLRSTAGFGLCGLLLAFAAPRQAPPTLALPQRGLANVLGNGGFEIWSLGHSFQGPMGPDLWFAMGDTSDVFTQGDIAFTQITGCPPGGDGSAAMQIRANLPMNYVSQSVRNFAEYAGKDLTFTVRARPLFPLANARIEIDDGVSSSSEVIQVLPNVWGSVTVHHTVSTCPTKLEFKIFPEQTIDVDEAMASVGSMARADFIPHANPEPGLEEVPLGTVLDWYRFQANVPAPAGFAICDGNTITDAASPFVGLATPNLASRFVRGVTTLGAIGGTGGSATHDHGGQTGINEGGFGFPSGPSWFMNSNQLPPHLENARHGHTHDISSASSLPPYIGLLKIIRIK